MTIMLWLFVFAAAIELAVVGLPLSKALRKLGAGVAMLSGAFAVGGIALLRPNFFVLLLIATSLGRAVNLLRIIEDRMHERYQQRATRRTALVFMGMQLGIYLVWLGWTHWHTTGHLTWSLVALAQLLVAAVLLWSAIRTLKRTAWPHTLRHYSDAELPTVTVAIPARNETEDLTACLESILANDYPKLEVIVIDDCSQTRRTPEIIRGYAHAGVRFIRGKEPEETWLPKNQAYDRLLQEATGQYIMFCGVDVRLGRDAVRTLISALIAKHKDMMSILPERTLAARNHSALAQAMRYVWEIAPPRRLFGRPPVLSSCWVMKRSRLEKMGGFAAVARSIVPEAHFARELIRSDGYSFMRAGPGLDMVSVKTARNQRLTAIRTRYPQVRRRPENVVVTATAEAVVLVLPFVLAFAGPWLNIGIGAQILAAVAAGLLTVMFWLIAVHTHVMDPFTALIALPVMAVYDIVLINVSMWQYEFSVVEWKGRNICVPAMHVIPHLPKLD